MRVNPLEAISLLLMFVIASRAAAGSEAQHYRIVDAIRGPDTPLWDYASVDTGAGRLYLASRGAMVLNLRTGNVTQVFSSGTITHGIMPLNDGTVALADGTKHAVEFFDKVTAQMLATVPVVSRGFARGLHDPDALVLEPRSGYLVAINGDSGTLALVDVRRHAVVDTIGVAGKLEFGAADGRGRLYVNIETKNAIAIIDVPNRKHVRDIALKDCESPTGLVYDDINRLVMSVCSNGLLKVVDPVAGQEIASIEVGRGADALIYDEQRGVLFSCGGEEGTLSIVSVRNPKRIAVIQTITTQVGARLGALDTQTGKIYLPTAKYDRNGKPFVIAGVAISPTVAGSFQFLIVEPAP